MTSETSHIEPEISGSVVKFYYLHLIIFLYKSSLKKQKKRFTSLKVVLYSFMQWSARFNHKRRHRRGSRKKQSCLWPYHPERARSRLISEAKQRRAWLVLGWEKQSLLHSQSLEPRSMTCLLYRATWESTRVIQR